MDGVSVLVFDVNRLFREALKQLLTGTRYVIRAEAGSLAEASDSIEAEGRPELLLFEPEGSTEPFEVIRVLRARLGDSRLVVLTNRLSSASLARALQAGADGYLLKDMSVRALTQSLDLAMVGEKVFPTQLARMLTRGGSSAVARAPGAAERSCGLSEREAAILRCLVHGYTNRAIADALRLTEASVKIQLKSVLRKIQAVNRTQAAIWALNNGFSIESTGAPEPLNRPST